MPARVPELAVLLAAGEGRRLASVLGGRPKVLAPVLHRSLLSRQLELLARQGLREVVLVVGDRASEVRDEAEREAPAALELTFVEQQERRGIAHALACAAPRLTRPFLLLLGDVHLETTGFGPLFAVADPECAGVLAIQRGSTPEERRRNYAVQLNEAGEARALQEKPGVDYAGELGIGLYFLTPRILGAIERTRPSDLRGERELTDALGVLLQEGERLCTAEVTVYQHNLNDAGDLLAANLRALSVAGEGGVHPSALVAPGARVRGSVIGAGATVEAGAELEECLVLPGEVVPAGAYRGAVFASGTAAVVAPPAR